MVHGLFFYLIMISLRQIDNRIAKTRELFFFTILIFIFIILQFVLIKMKEFSLLFSCLMFVVLFI